MKVSKPLPIIHKKLLLLSFMAIFFLYASTAASTHGTQKGTEEFPFNPQLRQLISQTFYEGSQVSQKKIEAYRQGIAKRYWQTKNNLKNFYCLKKRNSLKKAEKKICKKGDIEAYKILLDYILRLKTTTDPVAFNTLALKVLDLDDALKITGKRLETSMMPERLVQSLKSRRIPIHEVREGEAFNLVDPSTGLFFSQYQLARMKKKGLDISKLNPPGNSTFWQPHDIAGLDVKTLYQTGQDSLHKGLDIFFPRPNGGFYKAYYDEIRRTQTKPKVDIYIRDPHTHKKIPFKLKIGTEMHSEATAASLYAALGFSVDISKYVRDFKLVLGEVTPEEFKRDWNSYYSRYDVDRYIKNRGKDEEGYYIVFYEGLLEAKPRGLLRVGRWAYGRNGHAGLREVRGTLVFNMWVGNIDLHESENNKLVLRKIGGQYRFFHLQHDMGFAFGWAYIERPGEFKWNLLKKKTKDHVYLNYRSFQKNSGFRHITFADARWITRLIAQLSREQIQAAVEMGGWPDSMGKLLVEKLIARRNQLVKAFDLEGDTLPNGERITILPVNRVLTTADGVVVQGKLKKYTLPGFIQYFGPRIRELIPLILRRLKNTAVDGAVNMISGVRYIEIDPEKWLGWDNDLITRIIVRLNREIEPNPFPTGDNDSYLVKDTMQLGARLGYGFILSSDLTYAREYNVVYPVKTMDEGRYHNNFILNLLVRPQIKRFAHYTPEQRFALMIEDYLEARGRFKLASRNHVLEAGSLGISKVFVKRHFVSRKTPDRMVYFEEKGHFRKLALKIYLEFAYILSYRIPFFRTEMQKGAMKRNYVEVDLSDIEKSPGKSAALERLFRENDSSLIKGVGVQKSIDDKFFQRKSHFTLLGLIKRRSVYRVDRLKEAASSACRYQVGSHKQRTWRFLDNGEKLSSWIRMTGKPGKVDEIDDPILTISLKIEDKNTTDGELKKSYLELINTAALDKDFINFDSTAHSRNRRWGYTQVFLDMFFYKQAVEKLLRVDDKEIWKTLSAVTGHPVGKLIRMSKPPDYRRRPAGPRFNDSNRLAWKTAEFIRNLKKARKKKDTLKKITYLVKALRKAVYLSGHSYNTVLLSVIHQIVGKENTFMRGVVTMPIHKENMFPERIPLYNESGVKKPLEPVFKYIFEDPDEIYHIF